MDLRRRGLGRDGDRGSAHQREYRRRARLGLADGVVVGNDEPVSGGKLRGGAGGNRHGLRAGRADRSGEPRGERGGHVPVRVEPLGDVLGDGARGVHACLAQDGKHGVSHVIARPDDIGSDFVPRVAVCDLGVKEPIRLVGVRDRAGHREGARR